MSEESGGGVGAEASGGWGWGVAGGRGGADGGGRGSTGVGGGSVELGPSVGLFGANVAPLGVRSGSGWGDPAKAGDTSSSRAVAWLLEPVSALCAAVARAKSEDPRSDWFGSVPVWSPLGGSPILRRHRVVGFPLAFTAGECTRSAAVVGGRPRSAVSVAHLQGAWYMDEFTGWVRFLVACLAGLVEGAAPVCGSELQISSRSAAGEVLLQGSAPIELLLGLMGLLDPWTAPPTCWGALPIWWWAMRWSVALISMGVPVVTAVGAGVVIMRGGESPSFQWLHANDAAAKCSYSGCTSAPAVIHTMDSRSVVCPPSLCGYAPLGDSAPIGDLHPWSGAAHCAPGACWDAPRGDRSMLCVVLTDGELVPSSGMDPELVADLNIPIPQVVTCLDLGSFLSGSGGGDASPRPGK